MEEERADWRWAFAVAVLAVMVLSLSVAADATAGSDPLDPSFGRAGIATVTPPNSAAAFSLVESGDGGLLAAGGNLNGDFVLARFSGSGDLDPTFGNEEAGGSGYTIRSLGIGSGAQAVGLQANGDVVAAGSVIPGAFVVARFSPGGVVDHSFGRGGVARTTAGTGSAEASALAVVRGGKIVVAGSGLDTDGRSRGVVARYTVDGSPDQSFGRHGVLRISGGSGNVEVSRALALAGGKLLLAGEKDGRIMLIRLLANGKPDRDFGGGDGQVLVPLGSRDDCRCADATGLAVDALQRIVVTANQTGPRPLPSALVRFRSDGELDRGFGRKGIVRLRVGERFVTRDVAVERDGHVVVVGAYINSSSHEAQVAVALYMSDGKLDRGFADAGIFRRDLGAESVAESVLVQADGKIAVAGRANPAPVSSPEDESIFDGAEFMLMRFKPAR